MSLPEIIDHYALAPLTTTGLGGPARYFAEAQNKTQLKALLSWARTDDLPLFILGGGSNTVCSDAGFNGLVIQFRARGAELWPRRGSDEVDVVADAGTPWDELVRLSVDNDLAGLECLSGIPGSVGATPIQNVGAYGQEVSQTLTQVEGLDRRTGEEVTLSREQCGLGYRHSRFKAEDKDRYVITQVHFRLRRGGRPELGYPDLQRRLAQLTAPSLKEVRAAVLQARAEKSMLYDPTDPNHRSCGSFFLNPVLTEAAFAALCSQTATEPPRFPAAAGHVKVPAAWLIEQAGFKRGDRRGAVGLSTQHTLCLVCHEGATTADLLALAEAIQGRVQQRFGVQLAPEPTFLGLAAPKGC